MPNEIECKIPVTDRGAIAARLRELGAVDHGDVHECNRVFDTPEACLREGRQLLRLRNIDGAAEGILTYKGRPQENAEFKTREEIETAVGDVDAMQTVLARLGYVQTWFYEKRRHSWGYRGCEILLDELPALGCFVEVEGESGSAIEQVLQEIALDPAAHRRESYLGLYSEHCRKQGRPFGDMRFDAE